MAVVVYVSYIILCNSNVDASVTLRMRVILGGDKRTEINFFRLLNRCENMVKDSGSTFDWRVEKVLFECGRY